MEKSDRQVTPAATESSPGWPIVSLDEICYIASGITKGRKAPPEPLREVPYMAVANVQDGRLSLETVKTIQASPAEIERYQLLPGDLLLTEGGDPDKLGRGTVWNGEIDECIHQNHIFRVRVASSLVDVGFLSRLVASPAGKAYFLSKAKQTTGIASINLTQLRNFPVLLAPLNEQRRIAAKLDTTLAAVDACRQRLDGVAAILKRFRQAVLAAATSGELTREWREERGLSKDWKACILDDIASIQGGITKDSKKQLDEFPEFPYLRVANVQRGYLVLSEISFIRVPPGKIDFLLLEEGDILFNEGGDRDKVGRGWIWEGQIDQCVFQNHVFRARLLSSEDQPKFVSWWSNTRGADHFLGEGKQTTNLASISKKTLGQLPIQMPPPAEQSVIIDRVESLFSLADQLEARLTAARRIVERLTPALLAKAFRGELVPQDPGDEPASVLLERIRAARQADAGAAKSSGRGRKKAAALPDQLPLDAAPEPCDLLSGLLLECGALSERALLAASELDAARFRRQLQIEIEAGRISEAMEEGERVLVGLGKLGIVSNIG
jgi:type I restriction enzyme S subunit